MTPRMSKLATTAMIAAACGILTWTSIGCDALESASDKADKDVAKAVVAGTDKLRGSSDQAASTNDDIKKSLSDGAASLPSQIAANGMLYSTSWAQAESQLRDLDLQQVKIASLSWNIQLASDRIAAGNKLVNSYKQQEPTAVRKAASQEIQKVQGSNSDTSWVGGEPEIPSIVQSQLTRERLKKEIANYHLQLQGILEQRAKVLADSEKVINQSNTAKGQEAVDLFRKGTDLRIRASSLQVQADMLAAKILPLQSDLSLVESQLVVIQQAQKNLETQSAEVESGWKEVQKQADEQRALAQKILQTGDADPNSPFTSINANADELSKLLADSTERRQAVEITLESAAEYAANASKAAVKFQNTLGRSSLPSAQTELASAMNSSTYMIRQGQALHALAMSKAAHYRELVTVKAAHDRLDNALTGTGLSMPASLKDSTLDSQIKAAVSDAEAAFEKANTVLDTIAGVPGVSQDTIRAARAQQIITQYAWFQFAKESGQKDFAAHLDMAKSLTRQSVEDNALLPPLPDELGPTNRSALAPASTEGDAVEPR